MKKIKSIHNTKQLKKQAENLGGDAVTAYTIALIVDKVNEIISYINNERK